ncbi:folylpolyglutamate synthase/dihydrofolate synthase family protein [Ammoniphilus sp. YIM 78166]|uniref:bifunctional folylpolyglutamate synthase/dihydrofolate synthase n=1 Tax=Ammoniphilus sp. YIM 78166 TaxID=1644106 RepID=UPI00106F581A|nr:hypothetical protein [Ammoniphilus sp. YIM 78166]
MTAEELLKELGGKRLFATPEEKRKLIHKLAQDTNLLPYPIPIILVTGTCGKGSTTLFLSSILEEHGLSVGLVQSPHFISFNERIQVDRTPLPENEILAQIDLLLPSFLQAVEPSAAHPLGALNYNQVFLLAGLHLFLMKQVDFVILETGIGGYNDPVSYFTPVLSIITNIFKDHEAVLGSTFELIAYDKSGVIKEGVPVVTGTSVPEALQVLKTEANKKNAPLYCLHSDFFVQFNLGNGTYVEEGTTLPYRLGVAGNFQWENSAIAIKSSFILKELGYPIESDNVAKALVKTFLPGRFQILDRSPLTVIDGAHNEEEIRRFCETVRQFECNWHYFILGFSQDKQLDHMLKWFDGLASTFLFVPHSNTIRVKDPVELANNARQANKDTLIFESLEQAYEYANKKANASDGIFFTGSMFIAGDALRLLTQTE